MLLCLQVTKRVGGHRPVQALQQTQRICSDETSAWVSSQTRYVCVNLPVCSCEWVELEGNVHETCFLPFVSSLTDIPVFPTITATVTFQEFRYDDFEESIFSIPADYKEDPSRFPDLWPVNTSRKWPASEYVREVGNKTDESCNVLLLYIDIYSPFFFFLFFLKGNWSCWSVIVHFADGSKANQCNISLRI